MAVNTVGGSASLRAGLEATFNRGVNVGSPIASPSSSGGVYRVLTQPGAAPINRGSPLPSGQLQPNWQPDPFVTYQPGYGPSYPRNLSAPIAQPAPNSGWQAPRPATAMSAPPSVAPYRNRLPTVNRALDPGWRAGPAPVNQTPASANITPKPLSGPVAAPPAFRAPTVAPRPAPGSVQGSMLLMFQVGNYIGGRLGQGFADWAAPDRAAFENLPPGAVGPLPGVGVAATAGASRSFGDNFSRASTLPAIPKPSWMPDWAWPYPAPPIPNELPPDALGQGPKTSEGDPGTVATGTVAGVLYRLEFSAVEGGAPTTREFGLGGPVSVQVATDSPFGGYRETLVFTHDSSVPGATSSNPLSLVRAFTSQFGSAIVSGGTYTLARADGGQDPVVGATAPTYAPNPARRPPASSPAPRTLPPPVAVPQPGLTPTGATNPNGAPAYAPSGNPWPGSDPAYRPEPPLAPTPAAPPNFQPSELGESAPTFDPAKDIASQPDLENPAATAPSLQDNPGTPPVPQPFSYTSPTGTQISRGPDGSIEISRPVDDPTIQISGIPGINSPPIQRPQVPLIVPLPMRQPAITPRNPAQPFPPSSTTPQTPTTPNPNIDTTPRPRPPATPNPNPRALCRYEQQRAMDIQRKATSTEQRAANPVSGFPGLYGLQIESRIKQGQIFDVVTATKDFMKKAWETTRIQKVLDVLTFIGVMHNVSMLSRDVGETFFQLIGQGIQAAGVRDEEGGIIDVPEVVGDATESFLRRVLGSDVYDGINEARNKANRIISSASAVIWTVRSIADSSLDLMEWIGEHTGKIGNSLKRWGVIGERDYPWMSENAQAQNRFRARFSKLNDTLENAEDYLSTGLQATGNIIEIQEETAELGENWQRFRQSVEDGIPDPWQDNLPLKEAYDEAKAESNSIPPIPPSDTQKGT